MCVFVYNGSIPHTPYRSVIEMIVKTFAFKNIICNSTVLGKTSLKIVNE